MNKKSSSGRKTIDDRSAVAIYDGEIEEMENRIVTLKRDKEAYDAGQEERKIQRWLEEDKRILEMPMQMKKKEEREKEEKTNKDLLNVY